MIGWAFDLRMDSLSIAIPALNEEGALEGTVREVAAVLPGVTKVWEIIVVDDGSRDRTWEIAGQLCRKVEGVRCFRHERNLGLGQAFRTALRKASHEHFCLIPADGQFPAEDLTILAALTSRCDIAVGWRRNRPDPLRRKIVTLGLRATMYALFGIGLRDIGWVKIFKRSLLLGLDIDARGMGFDAEIVVKARRKGARFAEARVGYRPRTTGRSSGDDPRHIFRTVREILRLC